MEDVSTLVPVAPGSTTFLRVLVLKKPGNPGCDVVVDPEEKLALVDKVARMASTLINAGIVFIELSGTEAEDEEGSKSVDRVVSIPASFEERFDKPEVLVDAKLVSIARTRELAKAELVPTELGFVSRTVTSTIGPSTVLWLSVHVDSKPTALSLVKTLVRSPLIKGVAVDRVSRGIASVVLASEFVAVLTARTLSSTELTVTVPLLLVAEFVGAMSESILELT